MNCIKYTTAKYLPEFLLYGKALFPSKGKGNDDDDEVLTRISAIC